MYTYERGRTDWPIKQQKDVQNFLDQIESFRMRTCWKYSRQKLEKSMRFKNKKNKKQWNFLLSLTLHEKPVASAKTIVFQFRDFPTDRLLSIARYMGRIEPIITKKYEFDWSVLSKFIIFWLFWDTKILTQWTRSTIFPLKTTFHVESSRLVVWCKKSSW